jgi:2-phosphosulfolactate phosphatase
MAIEISVDSLLGGARRATGAVAIIDVFRAFTTAAVALANGASRIVMVGTIEEALSLRDRGLVQICMGERHGELPAGFDFSNSPFAVSQADLRGKAIAQRTSAGTQGIVAASAHAACLCATALVTAKATARACLAAGAERICLVAMGRNGTTRTDEDELCALHIRNILEGRAGNAQAVRDIILAAGEAPRFNAANPPHLYPEDLTIALDVDRYDFAVAVSLEDGRPVARMRRV